MPRWLRVLLTTVAALVGAYGGMIVIGGGAAGIAWIFLFGDDAWPDWSEIVIAIVAMAGALWGGLSFGVAAWRSTSARRT